MASLGSLVIQIAADTGLLSKDMGRAAAIVERNSRRMQHTLSAVFAGLTGAGFVAFVKKSLDAAAAQREVAESVGLSVTALSELKYAAGQNGVEFEGLSTALVKFNNLLADGVAGKKEAVAALDRMGISVKGLRDGSITTEKAIGLIADRIQSMPDGFQKTALATDAFGRAGAALIPTLNGGAKGLEELARRGREAGAVLDDSAAKAAQHATDKLRALHDEIMTKTVVALAALAGARPEPMGEEVEAAIKKMKNLRAELELREHQVPQGSTFVDDLRARYIAAREEVQRLVEAQKNAYGLGSGPPKPKPGVIPPPVDADAAKRAADEYERETKRLLGAYDETGQALRQLTTDQQLLFDRAMRGKITWEEYAVAIEGVRLKYEDLGAEDIDLQEEEIKAAQAALDDLLGVIESTNDPYAQWERDIHAVNTAMSLGVGNAEEWAAAIEAANQRLAESGEELQRDSGLSEFALQAQRNIQGLTASLIKGEYTAKSFGQAVVQALADIAAELLATQLLQAIFGSQDKGGSWSGGALSGLLNGLGNHRASGGLMGAGTVSEVNERGTEMLSIGGRDYLLMGSQAGSITPAPAVEAAGKRANGGMDDGALDTGPAGLIAIQARASGGLVSAGGMYEVNERGTPEVLSMPSGEFLMMGNQAGNVMPAVSGGGGSVRVNVSMPIDARGAGPTEVANLSRGVQQAMQQLRTQLVEDLGRGRIKVRQSA